MDARREEIEAYALRKASRRPGVSIANVMRKFCQGMRPSSLVLFDLEARGRLTRTGGEPGKPLLWLIVRNQAAGNFRFRLAAIVGVSLNNPAPIFAASKTRVSE